MAAAPKDIADFSIKPEAVTPTIPTSEWPLLLKNYDQRELPLPFYFSRLSKRVEKTTE